MRSPLRAGAHARRPSRLRRAAAFVARIPLPAYLLPFVVGCSWFTDFKQQPKIDPWETASDTIPFRGNPQNSVPITGSAAPGFLYARAPLPQNIIAMQNIPNPVAADSASVNRGRIQFQINCAVCHGPAGLGNGVVTKYGLYPPAIGGPNANAAKALSDGYIFGIIRNGRGLMPSYNRIEDADRWDIINYLRTLEGKGTIAADTSHCRPGETGVCAPAASTMGPTVPSPYYHPRLASEVPAATPVSAAGVPARGSAGAARVPTDTTKKPELEP
jgi:mono/diheme cytochrome c family protein